MAGPERRVKILVVGDLHYTRRRPKRRKDDFINSVHKKMADIVDMTTEAHLVILTGDIFHSRSPTWQEFVDVASWLSRINVPKLICAGNHDLVGGNFGSVNHMPLGIIRSLGLARVPSGLVEELGLMIHVMPYSPTTAASDYELDDHVDVMLTHDLLYPEKRQLPFEYRYPNCLPPIRAKVVVCGHVHIQASGRIQYAGVNGIGTDWTTEFVWPGPVIRGSTGHEFAQHPAVTWLDVGGKDCKLSTTKLMSAMSFEEAFDVDAYEEEKRVNAEFDEFVAGLRKAEMRQDVGDVFVMVRQSESYKAMPDHVRLYVENFLQEVERAESE